MSGGRSRRKKLVRSKRLSKTDSEVEQENINADASAAVGEADSANANQEILEQTEASTIAQEAVVAEAATGSEQETGSSEQPPPLETVSCEPANETESAFNTTDEASALSAISASKNHEQQLDDLNTEIQLAGMYISPENCSKSQTI